MMTPKEAVLKLAARCNAITELTVEALTRVEPTLKTRPPRTQERFLQRARLAIGFTVS